MNSNAGHIELDWSHATAEIAGRSIDVERDASQAQREAIATALDVMAVERLGVRYRIEALPAGRYRLSGEINARVVQACVVTLDPVASDITEQLEIEFLPSPKVPGTADEEQSILGAEEHEPIENERLAIGRIVFETLAAALPLYPRSDEAALEKHEAGPETADSPGPFSALAGWRPKGG